MRYTYKRSDNKRGKIMDNKKAKEIILVNEDLVQDKIYIIRGQKVMLDVDLWI